MAKTTPTPGAEKTVIKAKDGKWPDPPFAGRWSRDKVTGDLTLEQEISAEPTDEQRQARRAALHKASGKQHTPKE